MSDVSTFVVVVSQDALQAFRKPGLDLQTGEIIELSRRAEPDQVQLELPLEIFYPRLQPCQMHCAEGNGHT